MKPRPLAALTFLVSACLAVGATPDFAAAERETVSRLEDLIRIDTSNLPGNETKLAEYLKAELDREGIPSEILALEPHRGNLVARLKGSGRKPPILLMAHTDVVGVDRDKWTVDPFAAVTKDGYLYGRGSSDDKSMVSAFLQIVLMLHREKTRLDRDVIFAAVADEEQNAVFGMRYLIERHWDKIACEYAINEGGNTVEEDGRVKFVGIATTEKIPRTFFLAAKGTSTHASRPRTDNPITHLAAAVAKVGEWQAPMRLNETTREFFQRLATVTPPAEAWLYARLEDPIVGMQAQEIIRRTDPVTNSMLRTTISPTILKGGFRVNVIPADATATLDVRMLPDEDPEQFADTLRKLINDPAVDVIAGQHDGRQPAAPSRLDSELYRALDRARELAYPDTITIPIMSTGATDSAYLRARGVQVYGVRSSAELADGGARAHGNDERLKLDGVRPFVEMIYRAVHDVAAAK
jgi:acetylornithine deacetylase/succinyl-diaminopimelate desuccinylase-like protein